MGGPAALLSATAARDGAGLFRKYLVTGQMQANDSAYGDYAAAVRGTAEDKGVWRENRVLVIRAEGAITPELATKRAQWEATVRAARADTFTVRVQGWTQADGTLWPVNRLVRVRSPMLGIEDVLLTASATYTLDENSGTTTELRLVRKDAFTPQPYVPPAVWGEIAGGV